MAADLPSPRRQVGESAYRPGPVWKLGAAFTAALGLLLLIPPLGRGLINLSYDLPYLIRPNIAANEVTLVYLDVESQTRLGQQRQQNWDRGLHARLIDRLTSLG